MDASLRSSLVRRVNAETRNRVFVMFGLKNIHFQHVEKPVNRKKSINCLCLILSFYNDVLLLEEMLILVKRSLTEKLWIRGNKNVVFFIFFLYFSISLLKIFESTSESVNVLKRRLVNIQSIFQELVPEEQKSIILEQHFSEQSLLKTFQWLQL